MKIEVDQSGRIEETNRDTVLALSNGVNYSIRIHRRTKRKLLEDFRKQGKPKLFTIKVFSAGVYFLIKDYINKTDRIVIDVEYDGKSSLIKSILAEYINGKNEVKGKISFKSIGRKSNAHILAIEIYRKNKKADRVISYKELTKLINKKSR